MRDPRIEQFLNHGQWKFEYHPKVNLELIDMRASDENPARMNRRLEEARALQYAELMENGVEFPAIVLLVLIDPKGPYKYLVATGMHRLAGATAAMRTMIDAYVVFEPDIYRREVLVRMLNAVEGRGDTMAEQMAHLIQLKEQFPGKALTELAKEWSLKASTVRAAYEEHKTRLRARRLGFDLERSKMQQKIALSLGTIHSDMVLEKALEFVTTTAGVPTAEIKEMAAEIKKARDEAASMAIVRKYREAAEKRLEAAKAKHGRVRPLAINRVIRDCRRLNSSLEVPHEQLHVAALEDRRGSLLLLRATMDNLKRLIIEIERVERMTMPASSHAVKPEFELRV